MGPTRGVLALVAAVAGCGGGGSGGADEPEGPRRVVHLAIETSEVPDANPPRGRVDLVMTDHTGASDRVEIGEFPGPCEDTSASHLSDPMSPILSVDCTGEGGIALRFVHRGPEVIVLRARHYEGEEQTFDEHTRIGVPSNAIVKTDH